MLKSKKKYTIPQRKNIKFSIKKVLIYFYNTLSIKCSRKVEKNDYTTTTTTDNTLDVLGLSFDFFPLDISSQDVFYDAVMSN